MTSEDAYNELCYYTLAHRDPSFIHQYVVDAFAAQYADEQTKPIKLTFALVGLYLHVEKQFSGKLVQRVHMDLAQQKRLWPSFALPNARGALTAADVLAVPTGSEATKRFMRGAPRYGKRSATAGRRWPSCCRRQKRNWVNEYRHGTHEAE